MREKTEKAGVATTASAVTAAPKNSSSNDNDDNLFTQNSNTNKFTTLFSAKTRPYSRTPTKTILKITTPLPNAQFDHLRLLLLNQNSQFMLFVDHNLCVIFVTSSPALLATSSTTLRLSHLMFLLKLMALIYLFSTKKKSCDKKSQVLSLLNGV